MVMSALWQRFLKKEEEDDDDEIEAADEIMKKLNVLFTK